MKKTSKTSRWTAVLMALIMLIGAVPASAQEAQPGQVTTHFVGVHTPECTVGFALAPAQTRQGEAILGPDIPGRTFVGYEQETTHIYSVQHLPYIQGLVQNTIPLTLANSMLSKLKTNAIHCEKASNSNKIVSEQSQEFLSFKSRQSIRFCIVQIGCF